VPMLAKDLLCSHFRFLRVP